MGEAVLIPVEQQRRLVGAGDGLEPAEGCHPGGASFTWLSHLLSQGLPKLYSNPHSVANEAVQAKRGQIRDSTNAGYCVQDSTSCVLGTIWGQCGSKNA
jgi:hypothetical protein